MGAEGRGRAEVPDSLMDEDVPGPALLGLHPDGSRLEKLWEGVGGIVCNAQGFTGETVSVRGLGLDQLCHQQT